MNRALSNQLKSQRVGMTIDSSNGLEVQVLSLSWFFQSGLLPIFKTSHQHLLVKCEVPCHTTKFEPCFTFGPPYVKNEKPFEPSLKKEHLLLNFVKISTKYLTEIV